MFSGSALKNVKFLKQHYWALNIYKASTKIFFLFCKNFRNFKKFLVGCWGWRARVTKILMLRLGTNFFSSLKMNSLYINTVFVRILSPPFDFLCCIVKAFSRCEFLRVNAIFKTWKIPMFIMWIGKVLPLRLFQIFANSISNQLW